MFENKEFEDIHYSRFIASYSKKSKDNKFYYFREWLATLTINGKKLSEDQIYEIYKMATNGKLELENSVTEFIKTHNEFGKRIVDSKNRRIELA